MTVDLLHQPWWIYVAIGAVVALLLARPRMLVVVALILSFVVDPQPLAYWFLGVAAVGALLAIVDAVKEVGS